MLRDLQIYIQENLRVNFDFHLEFNGICVCKNKGKATILYRRVPELLKLVFQCILEKKYRYFNMDHKLTMHIDRE